MTFDAVVHERFDDVDATLRPQDAAGNLGDLDIEAGLARPSVVDACVGRGRRFVAATGHGYRAQDVVSGSTLLTRDCTIQAIVNWQLAAQQAVGLGTLYARGKGGSAAEYMGAGLELRAVNLAANAGELRWIWHDTSGTLKTQIGGHFYPAATDFLLLTATRRWVSSTQVMLRYYLADLLLAEITSADGSIGGGTTGTTSIGARWTGAAWSNFLDGTIDELRVLPRELTIEEIRATWERITIHQPAGYQLFRELHDPGFPISADPTSRVQRETRWMGNALGFAAAQGENLRNVLPTRAYGEVLEAWEDVTKQAPKPGDSVDTRRARVVARLRRTDGVSIPGLEAALVDLIDTDASNLQILAFDQTVVEDFSGGLDATRWWSDPAADWTISSGALRVQAIAGDFTLPSSWKRNLMSIGGEGAGVQLLAKVTPTTIPDGSGAGIILSNKQTKNEIALVLLRSGTHYFVNALTITAGALPSSPYGVDLGTSLPSNIWLHLYQGGAVGFGGGATNQPFTPGYSLTGPTSGFVYGASFMAPGANQWAGHVFLSTAVTAGAADFKFDDTKVRAPAGTRSFFLYVYRDPALPGRPDLVGANHVIKQLKQAHTWAAVITNKQVLCDDVTTPCDLGPLGGL